MSRIPANTTAESAPGQHISIKTLRAVERAASAVATRAVAQMDEHLAWFRTLPADQRSWVTLVAGAGISGYVGWVENPRSHAHIVEQVFGTAPRNLTRAVSLRRTVELVRVAITVAEEHLPTLGKDASEQAALRESLLKYSREIAFAAAAVYATAAENRSSWDARVEAAVVDGIVRGEDPQSLASRAATLSWDPTASTQVIVGRAVTEQFGEAVAGVADWAGRAKRHAMAAVHDTLLVVVIAGEHTPDTDIADLFAEGPVIRGPIGTGLAGATLSAKEALSAYRVARAWPDCPRPAQSAALLPERVLAGDTTAGTALRTSIFTPLVAHQSLLETLDAYVAHGGALEPAARTLFIHANTMRYRLRRIIDITGYDPWQPRDLFTLTVALIAGRLTTP